MERNTANPVILGCSWNWATGQEGDLSEKWPRGHIYRVWKVFGYYAWICPKNNIFFTLHGFSWGGKGKEKYDGHMICRREEFLVSWLTKTTEQKQLYILLVFYISMRIFVSSVHSRSVLVISMPRNLTVRRILCLLLSVSKLMLACCTHCTMRTVERELTSLLL